MTTAGIAQSQEPASDIDLDARYGRTPGVAKRNRVIAIILGGVFVLVFAAWAIWAGLLGAPAQVEVRDTGHSRVSDSELEVSFEVTVPAGSTASCAIQALNEEFTIVGWKIVDLAASDDRTRSFVETVRTSEPAVTGLIYRCWLT